MKLLLLPLLPFIFLVYAYLELGGAWYAYRFLERQGIVVVTGMIIFSISYSLIAVFFALKLKVNMTLLMMSYGCAFTLVSALFRLEWGKLPILSLEFLRAHPSSLVVVIIASVGFLISSYQVVMARPTT